MSDQTSADADVDTATAHPFAESLWDGALAAFLVVPPAGFFVAFAAGLMEDLGDGAIGFLIVGALFSYILFGVPALVAGALFGLVRASSRSVVLSLASAAAIGFSVTAAYVQLVFGADAVELGVVGAVTGFVYAIWVECGRWADDLSTSG